VDGGCVKVGVGEITEVVVIPLWQNLLGVQSEFGLLAADAVAKIVREMLDCNVVDPTSIVLDDLAEHFHQTDH
jgi:hypothetical protein